MIRRERPDQQWAEVRMDGEEIIPLFLVYSSSTVGLGDCGDLRLIVERMARENRRVLHVLPLNEMNSGFDPYRPLSLFSLEPFHIRVQALPGNEHFRDRIEELKCRFPPGVPDVNLEFKEKKFNLLWDMYVRECESGELDGEALSAFVDENVAWLPDYAMFKVLRDAQDKRPWTEWEARYRYRDRDALEAFTREHEKELIFDYWVQMHAYRQFRGAKEYASSAGVMLKGEMPMYTALDCSDVWAHPSFFGKPGRSEMVEVKSPAYTRERIKTLAGLYHIISTDTRLSINELVRLAQGENVLFSKETTVSATLPGDDSRSNFIRFWLSKGLIRAD